MTSFGKLMHIDYRSGIEYLIHKMLLYIEYVKTIIDVKQIDLKADMLNEFDEE